MFTYRVDPMVITIRQGTPDDFSIIVDAYGPADTPWDPFGSIKRLKTIPLEGLLIAEVDNEFAGFLYWFIGEHPWFDSDTSRFAYIAELHIVKKFQGEKVGTTLLSGALKKLREMPVPVYISCTEDNAVAHHMYKKAGFKVFSRSIHYKQE
jgi:ribosomal protein S18 acetylase RimI-like enzyme